MRVFSRCANAGDEIMSTSTPMAPAPTGGVSQPLEGKTGGWGLVTQKPEVMVWRIAGWRACFTCCGGFGFVNRYPRCLDEAVFARCGAVAVGARGQGVRQIDGSDGNYWRGRGAQIPYSRQYRQLPLSGAV